MSVSVAGLSSVAPYLAVQMKAWKPGEVSAARDGFMTVSHPHLHGRVNCQRRRQLLEVSREEDESLWVDCNQPVVVYKDSAYTAHFATNESFSNSMCQPHPFYRSSPTSKLMEPCQ